MKLRKLLLALIAMFTLSTTAQAQDFDVAAYKGGEFYKGYVVDLSGNKTEGYIKFSNRVDIQSKVVFYLDKNNKKTKIKYKAKDLKEYKFGERTYRTIPYAGSISKATRGVCLMEDGCIQYYMFYDRDKAEAKIKKKDDESLDEYYGRIYPSWPVFVKTSTGEARGEEYYLLSFVKKMTALIGDNAELSAKITNKEKGYKMLSGDGTILKIVREYNDSCKM